MRWLVEFEPAAAREFKKLERPVREAIAAGLAKLTQEAEAEANPFTNARKLAGGGDRWRLRVGDYRAIFTLEVRAIDPPSNAEDEAAAGEVGSDERELGAVIVVRVAHRREVYQDK